MSLPYVNDIVITATLEEVLIEGYLRHSKDEEAPPLVAGFALTPDHAQRFLALLTQHLDAIETARKKQAETWAPPAA